MTAQEARKLAKQMTVAEEVRKKIDEEIEFKAKHGHTECTHIEEDDLFCDYIVEGLKNDGFTGYAQWEKVKGKKQIFVYHISWSKFELKHANPTAFVW